MFLNVTYSILGDFMSNLVAYTSKELDLLARLMRAEAVGEGDYGMLMVGNVGVNRVLANCYTSCRQADFSGRSSHHRQRTPYRPP